MIIWGLINWLYNDFWISEYQNEVVLNLNSSVVWSIATKKKKKSVIGLGVLPLTKMSWIKCKPKHPQYVNKFE